MRTPKLPPRQQLAAPGKWPRVGERLPRQDESPWRVYVEGAVERPQVFELADLQAWTQVERPIDIHCVTRWSKLGVRFRGVPLSIVLEMASPDSSARFVSFVARSDRSHSTSLPLADAIALGTLLAWSAEGTPLEAPHGGPVRVIVPGRYFYKSLKWLERIELLAEDRLGFWEGRAGYHNTGDVWREQRYVADRLSQAAAATLLAGRDLSGLELRGLAARDRDLEGLAAKASVLRDADFRGCRLRAACFDEANLSNARFDGADLRDASFRGADAEGADFTGADLRGASFLGARLLGCTFGGSFDEVAARGAVVDNCTRFDPPGLDALTPAEQTYLAAALRPDSPRRFGSS